MSNPLLRPCSDCPARIPYTAAHAYQVEDSATAEYGPRYRYRCHGCYCAACAYQWRRNAEGAFYYVPIALIFLLVIASPQPRMTDEHQPDAFVYIPGAIPFILAATALSVLVCLITSFVYKKKATTHVRHAK